MKRVLKMFLVFSIVLMFATSMQARPNEDGSWRERALDRIVKILKKVRSFGDGLIDPRP